MISQLNPPDNMASNEGTSKDSAAPGLSHQNWDEFHSGAQISNLTSIDILLPDEQDSGTSNRFGVKAASRNAELPDRIRINSSYLVQSLTNIRGSNHLEHAPIIMFRPYKTLVYFDQEIRHAATELEKRVAMAPAESSPEDSTFGNENKGQLAHFRCLVQFMDTYLSARIEFLQSLDCDTIFFSDLWLLYKPGDFVISRDLRQVHQVIRVETKRSLVENNNKFIMEDESVVIHCVCVDFDGQWLGPVLRKVAIKAWGLSKHIESLELSPLTRAINAQKVLKQDLIRRGQTFLQVAGVSPVHYDGCTLDSKMQVKGIIIVDFQEALRDDDNFKTWRTTIEHSLSEPRIFATGFDEDDEESHAYSSKHSNPHEDSYVDNIRYQTYIQSQHITDESGYRFPSIAICPRLLTKAEALTEEELLIMSYRAFGYILDAGILLTSGTWGELFTLALAFPSLLTNYVHEKVFLICPLPHQSLQSPAFSLTN